jgi:hypothetical protein
MSRFEELQRVAKEHEATAMQQEHRLVQFVRSLAEHLAKYLECPQDRIGGQIQSVDITRFSLFTLFIRLTDTNTVTLPFSVSSNGETYRLTLSGDKGDRYQRPGLWTVHPNKPEDMTRLCTGVTNFVRISLTPSGTP